MFSKNGKNFYNCEDGEIEANYTGVKAVNAFKHPFEARIVRVHPLKWEKEPALRFDVFFEYKKSSRSSP